MHCTIRNPRPFRGFLPYSVLPTARSHLPPAGTTPNRLRCAPRVSHPLDALLPARSAELVSSRSRSWASPFEAFVPALRRTSSRTPLPSRFSLHSFRTGAPPQGMGTPRRSQLRAWGLARFPSWRPPWTFSPPRFLVPCHRPAWLKPTLPSRAFPARSHADLAVGTPGFL